MDLYIRSQDRLILEKNETLQLCQNPDGTWFFNSGLVLGKYKTKERALEVLDEIQNLLQPKIIYTQKEPIETFELGVYKLKQDVDIKIQEVNRIVYEMPQD